MKTLYCQRCRSDVVPVLYKNGPHVQANCSHCQRYIKFVSAKDVKEFNAANSQREKDPLFKWAGENRKKGDTP